MSLNSLIHRVSHLHMPTMAIGSGWLWSSIVLSGMLMKETPEEGRVGSPRTQCTESSAARKYNFPHRLENCCSPWWKYPSSSLGVDINDSIRWRWSHFRGGSILFAIFRDERHSAMTCSDERNVKFFWCYIGQDRPAYVSAIRIHGHFFCAVLFTYLFRWYDLGRSSTPYYHYIPPWRRNVRKQIPMHFTWRMRTTHARASRFIHEFILPLRDIVW